jgi:hypothetical protein
MDLFTEHGARSERVALDALLQQAKVLGPHVAAGKAKRRGRGRRNGRVRLRLPAAQWLRHTTLDADHRTSQAT